MGIQAMPSLPRRRDDLFIDDGGDDVSGPGEGVGNSARLQALNQEAFFHLQWNNQVLDH